MMRESFGPTQIMWIIFGMSASAGQLKSPNHGRKLWQMATDPVCRLYPCAHVTPSQTGSHNAHQQRFPQSKEDRSTQRVPHVVLTNTTPSILVRHCAFPAVPASPLAQISHIFECADFNLKLNDSHKIEPPQQSHNIRVVTQWASV
eukprot:3135117-Amphidinium_carterae.1